MIFNPIIAILYNQKEKKWHPILFKESPLPGPISDDKPIRHRSVGHHTKGFDTRQEALDHINTKDYLKETCPVLKKCIDKDIVWDGEDEPSLVMFFNKDGTKILPLVLYSS